MKAYRFETKVSKTGIIQIPFTPDIFDKDVEVIIVPKTDVTVIKQSAGDFVSKWAGFLASENTDDSKYSYLSEKYK